MSPLPSKNFDVIFIVDNATRIICGHSHVLSARSVYFNAILKNMNKNNKRYEFEFPEYAFEIFDKILEFLYGDKIDVSRNNSEFVFNLMKAVKRFELTSMAERLQSLLIKSNWIYKNVENVFKLIPTVFDSEEFHLRELIIHLICKDTKWFINFKQFNGLSEEHLIKFLKIDNLSIEEFHIWNAVLGWMFANNANLNPKKKIDQWSDQELVCCRETLKPFIPFIRFFQISRFKYWSYIRQYENVLPEGLVDEIAEYYCKGSLPKIYPLLSLRNVRVIDSDLISAKQAETISLWIENKNLEGLEWKFKFNLLYSTRRDGFSVKIFHEKCDNKGATILVVSTDLSEEIIGGFNPVSWGYSFESEDFPRYSPDDNDETLPMDTEEELTAESSSTLNLSNAFLFSFKNNMSERGNFCSSIFGFIHNCGECGPCFGMTDLWIIPKAAHSKSHKIPFQPITNFGYHRQDSYEINLRDNPGCFQFKDYEVFQVICD